MNLVKISFKQRGFTLIELLVSLSIMALIMTLVLPRYQGAESRAKESVLRENLRQIRIAIDDFKTDKGRLAKDLDELVETKYLLKLPLDPITEAAHTWRLVQAGDGATGLFDVRSGALGFDGKGKAYADY